MTLLKTNNILRKYTESNDILEFSIKSFFEIDFPFTGSQILKLLHKTRQTLFVGFQSLLPARVPQSRDVQPF